MSVLLAGLLELGFNLLQLSNALTRLLLCIKKALGHILLCFQDLCTGGGRRLSPLILGFTGSVLPLGEPKEQTVVHWFVVSTTPINNECFHFPICSSPTCSFYFQTPTKQFHPDPAQMLPFH